MNKLLIETTVLPGDIHQTYQESQAHFASLHDSKKGSEIKKNKKRKEKEKSEEKKEKGIEW